MPDSSRRLVDGPNAQADDLVGFADGFPLLLTHQASLNDLNARMHSPLPMNRFRPNLVVSGGAAFSELSWSRIRIGHCEFVTGGPCVRCSMTTVDAKTGKPVVGGEPLKTLATYQRTEKGVILELTSSQDDLGRSLWGIRLKFWRQGTRALSRRSTLGFLRHGSQLFLHSSQPGFPPFHGSGDNSFHPDLSD